MTKVQAFAAPEKGADFQKYEYTLGEIGPEEVEIEVESCGICHSDLSMRDNDWGMTQYPFVGGHEVIGRIVKTGSHVKHVKTGQRVGIGWVAGTCMCCNHCINGDHNLCAETSGTITHQAGGFADRTRCHWAWAIPIPEELQADLCGPLLCGGVTVFTPILQHNLKPTARAAVVGIGGLGHMAVKFLKSWGCEVTAISRSSSKESAAREYGAHEYLATEDAHALISVNGKFDLIINTTNVALPWDDYIATLAPKGVLHTVGAGPRIEASIFPMLTGQNSLSSSPVGSIGTLRTMLDFCARHQITPETEIYPMDDINKAFSRLKEAPAKRLVLKR